MVRFALGSRERLHQPMDTLHRRFRPIFALLLALLAFQQCTSIRLESQTWDEGAHLVAGYRYLTTGDYRMNREHPPLAKLWCALPLLFLRPALPAAAPDFSPASQFDNGAEFLYRNRLPADTLLLAGRLMTILLSLALLLAIGLWTRRHFGAPAALLASALAATDPNLIAHGRYITTDMAAALGSFLAVTAWLRYLDTGRRRDLALAGLALGAALASKFSCVFLIPVLLLLFALRRPWRPWRSIPAAFMTAAALVALTYGPANCNLAWTPVAQVSSPNSPVGRLLRLAGDSWFLPAHPFLIGFGNVLGHNQAGHLAYLLGQVSLHGWWYYFPVIFAVKTPLAVLILIPAALYWLLRRRPRFHHLALALPLALYFMVSLTSRLNIGMRHLLPVLPFLYVLIGAAALSKPPSRARASFLCALLALQAWEVARIYPHYLAFFNIAAGGPAAGPRYALDSNIDWGQDVKKLKAYAAAAGEESVCISYFGGADLAYYGLRAEYLPRTSETEKRARLDCLAAASASTLYGLYASPEDFRWLRDRTPQARIGYSIYVYDLRKKK